MTEHDDWWQRPRRISVVVDNPSWVLPHAERLVARATAAGDDARLCRSHDEIETGAVAFYLGCMRITPPEVLARNRRNLVVHASDLPKGRGMSPWTWMILEGRNDIPVCLLEAVEELDAGPVIFKETLQLQGGELLDEIRQRLGEMHVELCLRFLQQAQPPEGVEQSGEPSYYPRRYPKDSELDPRRSIAEQMNLLRVVDNERYPAFFQWQGRRYRLTITPMDDSE